MLSAYGVKFGPGLTPSDILCPGAWFEALPNPLWTNATALPTSGNPVKAVVCSSSVPSSCGGAVPPPQSGLQCPTVTAGGDCIESAHVFQGLTSACPCLVQVGATTLECVCGPGPGIIKPPICSDETIVLNDNCGVCNCPDQTASCLYGCGL